MPKKVKSKKKTSSLQSKELVAEFQKINPYLQTNFAVILERLAIILAFLGFVMGNTSLVGTFLHNQLHITSLNQFITRPVVAVCFMLLSLGLLLTFTKKRHTAITFIIYLLGILSLLLISIGLLSHFQWLQHILYPYVPLTSSVLNFILNVAPNAGIILLLYSLAFLFLQKQKTIFLSQTLTLLGIVVLIPTDIGFLYGSAFIYNTATHTRLFLISALGLNVLAASLLFARSSEGYMRGLTEQTTGGFFARRFVFLAIVAPIVLGWIDLLGYNFHWYTSEARFLVLVTTTIVTFLVWAIVITRSLYTLDVRRRTIQNNIIFLSEASKILSSSLNYTLTLRKIAKLSVMQFAQWCSIELLTPDNKYKLLTIQHAEKRKNNWLATTSKKIDASTLIHPHNLTTLLKTGKSQFYPYTSLADILTTAPTKSAKQLFQRLPTTSVIQIPIRVQEKTAGIMQFAISDPNKNYTISDLHIAEELAARIALAIENARLYRNAQEAINIRDEFISMTSHELKTPLTSLKVYTEVLFKKFQATDTKTADYLLKMEDQITNMTNLIRDLLDISRIQVGKLTFHFEQTNLEVIVKDVVEILQPTIPHHTIGVTGSISHTITGDTERLRQVIINLLTNAAKYSAAQTPINVRLAESSEYVSVAVQDFGIGIDKKHLPKIFGRFYQVGNTSRASKGLGMGLYISSEIVRRHGGTITVQSLKGKGSTFTMTLPRQTKRK